MWTGEEENGGILRSVTVATPAFSTWVTSIIGPLGFRNLGKNYCPV